MSEPESATAPAPAAPPSRVPWPPIVLLAVIAAAVVLARLYPLAWPGLDDLSARVVGLSIGAGGIILAGWAGWTLHRAGTTIRPHRAADVLVTTGPFARLRNPIYVADVMLLLGAAELTKNIWFVFAAALFGLLVNFLAILPEERHLEARFGDVYRDYKSRSRRWL
ncbi:MAG: methyltransferase family protein [Hyphomicrobiaceae bacterium]